MTIALGEIEMTNSEMIRRINDYWKLPVMVVRNYQIVSHLQNGVPHAAFTTPYTHPDIVRVRRYGRNWYIVE